MWICQICYMGLFKLGPLCLKQCLKEEKNQICQNKSAAPPKIPQALTSKGASRRTGLYFTWSPFPWIARRDFSFSEKKGQNPISGAWVAAKSLQVRIYEVQKKSLRLVHSE